MGSRKTAAVTAFLLAGVLELNHLLGRVGAGQGCLQDARGKGQQKAPLAFDQEDHLLLFSGLLSTDCSFDVLSCVLVWPLRRIEYIYVRTGL